MGFLVFLFFRENLRDNTQEYIIFDIIDVRLEIEAADKRPDWINRYRFGAARVCGSIEPERVYR